MARFTSAFSLSHEVLNEIETRRGKMKRSYFVDYLLRRAFGLPIEEKENPQSQPPSNETGKITYEHNSEVIE